MQNNNHQVLKIHGQLFQLIEKRSFPAEILIENGRVAAIKPIDSAPPVWILPGFIRFLLPTRFHALPHVKSMFYIHPFRQLTCTAWLRAVLCTLPGAAHPLLLALLVIMFSGIMQK